MPNQPFSIQANTCTLLAQDPNSNPNTGLLDKRKYCIPIYQRPYSWGEEQLGRFIKSIVRAFREDEEPYFLGTVQIMPPTEPDYTLYNIIDGQQRFTTLLLLFKTIALHYPSIQLDKAIAPFDWLTTKVNKGEQQKDLDHIISLKTIPSLLSDGEELNTYLHNIHYIKNLLEELSTEDELEEDQTAFEVNQNFVNYCVSKLYFVVIETQASLSKTLDIFNTINTAGMDLNGGDLFKIQMFDYLTRIKNKKDIVFDEIDELYASIDQVNKAVGYEICSINSILEIYQFILIEKNQSSRALHGLKYYQLKSGRLKIRTISPLTILRRCLGN